MAGRCDVLGKNPPEAAQRCRSLLEARASRLEERHDRYPGSAALAQGRHDDLRFRGADGTTGNARVLRIADDGPPVDATAARVHADSVRAGAESLEGARIAELLEPVLGCQARH